MTKTYTFGKITLTQQALGIFIVGTITSLMMLLTLRSAKGAGFAVGMFLFTCYNTYMNNCLVVGDCNTLAWFLLGLSVLSAVSIPLRFKTLVMKNK